MIDNEHWIEPSPWHTLSDEEIEKLFELIDAGIEDIEVLFFSEEKDEANNHDAGI